MLFSGPNSGRKHKESKSSRFSIQRAKEGGRKEETETLTNTEKNRVRATTRQSERGEHVEMSQLPAPPTSGKSRDVSAPGSSERENKDKALLEAFGHPKH